MDFSIVSVDEDDFDEILFNTRELEGFSKVQLIVLGDGINERIKGRD